MTVQTIQVNQIKSNNEPAMAGLASVSRPPALASTPPKLSPKASPLVSKICEYTFTRSQLIRRLPLIQSLLNLKLFRSDEFDLDKSIDSLKKSYLEDYTSDFDFLRNLGVSFYDQFTPSNVHNLLKEINYYFIKLTIPTIYVPFQVSTEEQVLPLGNFAKKLFGRNFIFNASFDPELIGGSAFSLNGVYKDYSLRASINAYKDRVLKSLTEVKR